MKDFRKHPGFDKVCLVCCYKSKKDKHNKVIKGSNWRRHIEYVHKGDIPPYAILKRCNVADEVDYECRLSKELWGKLGELASTDVPPTKRNAPDDLSNIQLPQLRALENEFVQNDAPDSEPKFRKKHKSKESEENSTVKEVNALPVDQNENFMDQQDYYATRMTELE